LSFSLSLIHLLFFFLLPFSWFNETNPNHSQAPLVVESRGPNGEAQKSHWTTVVALASERPLKVMPGSQVD